MRKISWFIFFWLGVTAVWAVSPDDLIKVTPENDPKCVQYFMYKEELYCTTTASEEDSKPVDPKLKNYERLNIVFDDRPWQLAWGKKDESTGSTMLEYVPSGDNIDDWHELITSQYYPGVQDKGTLKQFADEFIEEIKEYHPTVTFLKNTDDQVIFEFRIAAPKNQIQDELQMLTKDDSGVYVLHYVVKKNDMGEEQRKLWSKKLEDSTIKE